MEADIKVIWRRAGRGGGARICTADRSRQSGWQCRRSAENGELRISGSGKRGLTTQKISNALLFVFFSVII
jgi:hypothetical protein